ncbi:MAG: alpha-amylase family glycosyl hydrolase [Elusimicrobia bacterium]|nr:alpha-amylase family glycosyl hydrolase [Elusimicrobiota bacterium]
MTRKILTKLLIAVQLLLCQWQFVPQVLAGAAAAEKSAEITASGTARELGGIDLSGIGVKNGRAGVLAHAAIAVPAAQPVRVPNKFSAASGLSGKRAAPVRAAADPLIGSDPEYPPEAPNSLAGAALDITSSQGYTSSPADWRDEIMYSVFLDRFARGPKGRTLGDPSSGNTRHGGDIQGLTSKLDYLKGLGVTTIILNPVILGVPEAYHGYAPLHLLAVDPYLGKMADFKNFVKQAHTRNIHVIFDLLINNAGPVFEYKGGSDWAGMDSQAKEIAKWNHLFFPTELAQPWVFSRRGVIGNWSDPGQAAYGDFPPNYRDYASEKPEVQAMLIHIADWWLKETDIDGFRIDAIRHTNPGFLQRFIAEARAYAAKLGKNNIYILGENSTGADQEVANDLKNAGVDSAYNYPEYRRNNWALHGKAPTADLENSFKKSVGIVGEDGSGRLLRFIDIHDTYRFLRKGEPVSLLKTAMAFLLFSKGIPLIYYGTEQGFRQVTDRLDAEGPDQPADPENRQDMFPEGKFKSDSSAGDKFDINSETYLYLRSLADVRKAHKALSRGAQYVRWSDPNGAGIYAFSRIYQGEEVLVVMNTSGRSSSAEMWVDANLTPAGTSLEDALAPGYKVPVNPPQGGGAKICVEVPAYGVRVLVKR